jgi:hypothetical protein
MRIPEIITNQYDIGITGTFVAWVKGLFSQTMTYVAILNTAMIAPTFWSSQARVSLTNAIPWLNFWMFIGIIAVAVPMMMLIEYKFLYPSAVRLTNSQTYKHKNPIYEKLDRMQADIDELKKLLREKDVS